jgi:hypothetical protein
MTNMKEVIEALRWGASEWDKTAVNPFRKHFCKLCKIFNYLCPNCPLFISKNHGKTGKCANWGRYNDAYESRDCATMKKEAAILASTMRWEAHKLENTKDD